MKNIIKIISASLLILATLNGNAGNLLVIKKDKFTSCEDIFYHGNYKGNGEYTIYDENNNEYNVNCELEQTLFKQENFSGLTEVEFNEILESNFNKIKIYHSEDLYFVFNKKDKIDIIEKNRFMFNTVDAIETVNTNSIEIGDYILISVHSFMSGVLTSNSTKGWCSPINGRYNGGCFNGSKGVGDWEIILF